MFWLCFLPSCETLIASMILLESLVLSTMSRNSNNKRPSPNVCSLRNWALSILLHVSHRLRSLILFFIVFTIHFLIFFFPALVLNAGFACSAVAMPLKLYCDYKNMSLESAAFGCECVFVLLLCSICVKLCTTAVTLYS